MKKVFGKFSASRIVVSCIVLILVLAVLIGWGGTVPVCADAGGPQCAPTTAVPSDTPVPPTEVPPTEVLPTEVSPTDATPTPHHAHPLDPKKGDNAGCPVESGCPAKLPDTGGGKPQEQSTAELVMGVFACGFLVVGGIFVVRRKKK